MKKKELEILRTHGVKKNRDKEELTGAIKKKEHDYYRMNESNAERKKATTQENFIKDINKTITNMVTMMFQFLDISTQEIPQEKKQHILLKSAKDLFKNLNFKHLEKNDPIVNTSCEPRIYLSKEPLQEDIPEHALLNMFEPLNVIGTTTTDITNKVEKAEEPTTVKQSHKKKAEKGQEMHRNMLNALLGAH